MKTSTLQLSAVGSLAAATAILAATTLGPADAGSVAAVHTSTPAARAGVHLIALPPPSQFVRHVTNPYLPFKPGSQWVYRGYAADKGERVVVKVLKKTKMIAGVKATVVSDRATIDGEVIEITHDWYAQDTRGRVWYLGEATTKFEGGGSSTAGSWETGVDGAKPGVVMFNRGKLNEMYAQEYFAGEAEDQGELLTRSARAVVSAGSYKSVRMTKDTTPLEPEVMEFKFYAPGVGLVLEVGTSPDRAGAELVSFKRG